MREETKGEKRQPIKPERGEKRGDEMTEEERRDEERRDERRQVER